MSYDLAISLLRDSNVKTGNQLLAVLDTLVEDENEDILDNFNYVGARCHY
jgi:hypothetical protein